MAGVCRPQVDHQQRSTGNSPGGILCVARMVKSAVGVGVEVGIDLVYRSGMTKDSTPVFCHLCVLPFIFLFLFDRVSLSSILRCCVLPIPPPQRNNNNNNNNLAPLIPSIPTAGSVKMSSV